MLPLIGGGFTRPRDAALSCCAADGRDVSVPAFAGSQHVRCCDEMRPAHLGPRPAGRYASPHRCAILLRLRTGRGIPALAFAACSSPLLRYDPANAALIRCPCSSGGPAATSESRRSSRCDSPRHCRSARCASPSGGWVNVPRFPLASRRSVESESDVVPGRVAGEFDVAAEVGELF